MGWFDFRSEPKDDLFAVDKYAEMIRLQRESMESDNKLLDELFRIATDPSNPEYDDWKAMSNSWRQVNTCQCGHYTKADTSMPVGNVCPKCGHTDKWETAIIREEWEYSFKMACRTARWRGIMSGGNGTRNRRIVRWTDSNKETA